MANEIAKRIVDFFKDGATVMGKGPMIGAAALCAASGVLIAGSMASQNVEAIDLPAAEGARLITEVQQRVDEEVRGAGILIADLRQDMKQQVADYAASHGEPQCIVYSVPKATSSIMPVAMGTMSETDFSRWMIYADVAQCLGAQSHEHAKVFATFMVHADTGPSDFPRKMAAWSDLNEIRGLAHPSEYYSTSAWNAVDALDDARVAQRVADGDVLDALNLSSKVWATTPVEDKVAFATGLRQGLLSGHHYVQVKDGLLDTTPISWMQYMGEDVEPVQHMVDLLDYLHGGAPVQSWKVQRKDIDYAEVLPVVEALGLRGDSTSRTIAKAMGSSIEFEYEPVVAVDSPFDAMDTTGYFYEVDIAGLYLTYNADGSSFATTDMSRRPIHVGMVHPEPAHLDQQEPGRMATFEQPRIDEVASLGPKL